MIALSTAGLQSPVGVVSMRVCRLHASVPQSSSSPVDGPLPDVMQHVDVPIITNKECEGMYRRAGYIEDIPNIFICAGLAKGAKDSCEVRQRLNSSF